MYKEFLCIGGPNDGLHKTEVELDLKEYVRFNCSFGKRSYRGMLARKVLNLSDKIPTAVWIHKDFFTP